MPKSTGKASLIKTLEHIMLHKDSSFAEKLEACHILAEMYLSQTQSIKPKPNKPKKGKSDLLG